MAGNENELFMRKRALKRNSMPSSWWHQMIEILFTCTSKPIQNGAIFGHDGDTLTAAIAKSCEVKKNSRSEWINAVCTTHLTSDAGIGSMGATPLFPASAAGDHHGHIMPDYDAMCRLFKIDVPEFFTFGFDVVDAWAKKTATNVR